MSKIIMWSDNHHFPSLPLMKISAYHKNRGDDVSLYSSGFECCDVLYQSKTFSFTDDLLYPPTADKVIQGGTGYAISVLNGKEVYSKIKDPDMEKEIDGQYPDYELYPEYKNMACGFLTRGCCNDCEFCIVSQKEGRCVRQVADLSDFWRGQKDIKLMDGNILACKDRERLLQQLISSGANIEFTQGLDARLITDDIAQIVCKTRIKRIYFAFDLMVNEKAILEGLKTFRKHYEKEGRVYILTNFNTTHEEDLYRIERVIELGYRPYVMIYQKGTHSKFLMDLARWANNPFLYRSCKFKDYKPRVDGKTCEQMYAL